MDIPCAVKFIDSEFVGHAETQTRFEREAKAAAQLRSPHVVQVLDHGICQGRPYIAMELLVGEDLGKRLKSRGRLLPSEVLPIIEQVSRALTKAHAAGIVHRDLKPDNIFLVRDDDREIVKVLDFGIAKSGGGDEGLTRVGALLGTPHYMSPEQAQGSKDIDHRSDLWSLAVICFRCLTGRFPFGGKGLGEILIQILKDDIPVPSQQTPDLPPAFDDWWCRAVDRNPAMRFQSAREFTERLAEALGIGRVPPPDESRPALPELEKGAARRPGSGTAMMPMQTGEAPRMPTMNARPGTLGPGQRPPGSPGQQGTQGTQPIAAMTHGPYAGGQYAATPSMALQPTATPSMNLPPGHTPSMNLPPGHTPSMNLPPGHAPSGQTGYGPPPQQQDPRYGNFTPPSPYQIAPQPSYPQVYAQHGQGSQNTTAPTTHTVARPGGANAAAPKKARGHLAAKIAGISLSLIALILGIAVVVAYASKDPIIGRPPSVLQSDDLPRRRTPSVILSTGPVPIQPPTALPDASTAKPPKK